MAKIGSFYPVDPKGTYLKPLRPGDSANAATSIAISALNLLPGDYLGLERTGTFYAGPNYPSVSSLVAVFRAGTSAVAPMDYGTQVGEGTSIGDIPQDFALWEAQNIVRIPDGAERIEFTSNDVWFSDNVSNGKFGVLVTKPNASPDASASLAVERNVDDSAPDCGVGEPNPAVMPLIDKIIAEERILDIEAVSYMTLAAPVPLPQYRGWYPASPNVARSYWNSSQSKYLGRGGDHKGVDIFAPTGTPVLAPVSGRFVPNAYRPDGDLGTNGIIIYRKGRRQRHCVLAHLATITASAGTIRAGQIVGTAGCSGTAGSYGNPPICGVGRQNLCGGRSDHVHIDVREGAQPTNNPEYVDPVVELRLTIRDPDSHVLLCNR